MTLEPIKAKTGKNDKMDAKEKSKRKSFNKDSNLPVKKQKFPADKHKNSSKQNEPEMTLEPIKAKTGKYYKMDAKEKPKRKSFNKDSNLPVKKQKFPADKHKNSAQQNEPGPTEKPDWKKMKEENKKLKEKRKMQSGGGEVYELGMKAKKIWEEVRKDEIDEKKRKKLCGELYDLVKGQVASLIFAHDTVRVIECLFGYGKDYRELIFNELKGDILKLTKNKYSKFFVEKILRDGVKEQKQHIINSFNGHVVALLQHKIACDVVELAFNNVCNAKQRSYMIQECYGPRFRYFKEDFPNLEAALEKHPEIKSEILSDVNKTLQPVLDKGVFTNTMMHTLMKEYLQVCGEEERNGIIEALKEHLLPIVHTRDGSRVAMLCLWYGTAKDRKTILKSFKGNYLKIATEEFAYIVLLAIFDCVDDTVFVCKCVVNELLENLKEFSENENSKKVLKYLIAPREKIFFHPDIKSVLEQGDKIAAYKKERSVKYAELQVYISKPVLELVNKYIDSWARTSQWTLLVGSALNSLHDDKVISQIFDSLAKICGEPYIPGDDKHFLEVSYMCKLMTFVIQADKKRFEEKKEYFCKYLLQIPDKELRSWSLTNRGCFLLVKMIETETPESEQIIEICRPLDKRLKNSEYAGAEVLLQKIN